MATLKGGVVAKKQITAPVGEEFKYCLLVLKKRALKTSVSAIIFSVLNSTEIPNMITLLRASSLCAKPVCSEVLTSMPKREVIFKNLSFCSSELVIIFNASPARMIWSGFKELSIAKRAF